MHSLAAGAAAGAGAEGWRISPLSREKQIAAAGSSSSSSSSRGRRGDEDEGRVLKFRPMAAAVAVRICVLGESPLYIVLRAFLYALALALALALM